ncbi:endonuclease domain-containing protein [Amycolatopsis sp. cmx-4-54]|uniref:endonuclease domain-containing protein n=1 Tax=Amycolatopsis sp. cmx-4-54 TaxID=2790936 RepID=UPI0039787E80
MTCHWWVMDGVRRFGNSIPMDAERFEFRVAWVVELGTERMLAGSVPPHLRCPLPVSTMWPRYLGGDTPISRIRTRLIAVFGEACAICGRAAQYVDHDHDSGLVRGMLCEFCNVSVEWCPHLSGCAFADYLASPPAHALAIRYPNRGRRRPAPLPTPPEGVARRAQVEEAEKRARQQS